MTDDRSPVHRDGQYGEHAFIVIGSQSILGSIPNPPKELKTSMEADMYPMHAPEKADLIDGALGEGSTFHDAFRYYAQGVGPETPILPEGWKGRLHRMQTPTPANQDKDREFDMELMRHGFVHTAQAIAMVEFMPVEDKSKRDLRARVRRWARLLKERGHPLPAG